MSCREDFGEWAGPPSGAVAEQRRVFERYGAVRCCRWAMFVVSVRVLPPSRLMDNLVCVGLHVVLADQSKTAGASHKGSGKITLALLGMVGVLRFFLRGVALRWLCLLLISCA